MTGWRPQAGRLTCAAVKRGYLWKGFFLWKEIIAPSGPKSCLIATLNCFEQDSTGGIEDNNGYREEPSALFGTYTSEGECVADAENTLKMMWFLIMVGSASMMLLVALFFNSWFVKKVIYYYVVFMKQVVFILPPRKKQFIVVTLLCKIETLLCVVPWKCNFKRIV